MSRTPALRAIRDHFRDIARAEARDTTLTEIQDDRALRAERRHAEGPPPTRRQFVMGAAAVAGAAVTWNVGRAVAQSAPRIAIVGGGIAGLSAALTLVDAGYSPTIYEAHPNRVGGRMLSERGTRPGCGSCHSVNRTVSATWADGQVTDVFGELIDTNHTTIRSLAERFGLGLTDLIAAHPAGSTDTYYFFGRRYPAADAQRDFEATYRALREDVRAAGYPTTWDDSSAAGRALDSMSVYDWIESRVRGGHGSPFGMLLDAAYAIEYGADTTDQSALNLVYMLGYSGRTFSIFGESDERYRLTGGIDLVTDAIGEYLGPESIELGWYMESIRQNAGGTYTLTFDAGGTQVVVADYVLLTVPFPVLRDLDYSQAGFDARKDLAIQTLGAAKNGKLHVQFDTRLWNGDGAWGRGNGNSYSDTGYQCTWESTRGQGGQSGILICYTGGSVVDTLALRHSYGNMDSAGVRTDTGDFLDRIEPVFPGISARWNGRAQESVAHLNPFFRSSYANLEPGQYQTICGYERVRQGNVFFAGEMCSQDFQGFMEGGAVEGVRAANEILSAMRGGRGRRR
ncbi:MAG: FAD-dependent oxidoreductase [Deltaproteobacteria bacterium]|nr:FAD-dependent oxidoreductase [Deltaproteobacteria bacterium]